MSRCCSWTGSFAWWRHPGCPSIARWPGTGDWCRSNASSAMPCADGPTPARRCPRPAWSSWSPIRSPGGRVTTTHSCYACGPTRPRESAPAEFVQPGVVDAEVVSDLVHHGDQHFLHHFVLGVAHRQDGLAVDRDPIRQFTAAGRGALGQGDAVIPADDVRLFLVALLDQRHDVVHRRGEFRRHLVQRFGDQCLEALRRHLHGHRRPTRAGLAWVRPPAAHRRPDCRPRRRTPASVRTTAWCWTWGTTTCSAWTSSFS